MSRTASTEPTSVIATGTRRGRASAAPRSRPWRGRDRARRRATAVLPRQWAPASRGGCSIGKNVPENRKMGRRAKRKTAVSAAWFSMPPASAAIGAANARPQKHGGERRQHGKRREKCSCDRGDTGEEGRSGEDARRRPREQAAVQLADANRSGHDGVVRLRPADAGHHREAAFVRADLHGEGGDQPRRDELEIREAAEVGVRRRRRARPAGCPSTRGRRSG